MPHWTKSLRDSLELTELVRLRGMRKYATLDRGWNVVPSRTSPLTDGRDEYTLFAWKERANTIPIWTIGHTPACYGRQFLKCYCATVTIQPTPKRSVTMPKQGDQKVFPSGI